MQNSGGVAILMLQNTDKIHFLTGNREMLERVPEIPAHATWDERTIEFLGTFSRNLLNDKRTKGFPDVTSYAFWIRNASLRQIKDHYYPNMEDKVGRGMAFHIAPSNVPVNFAVSFTSSLLAGNINVVRLSDKSFDQANIIIDALKHTFAEGYQDYEQYLILIRYEHDEEITDSISSMCDVRIIWGGDRTIKTVRKAGLPPRAIEMSFADRHSVAILKSEDVLSADIDKLAGDFYTDTYYIDQNACSSPRIVIWFGDKVEEARIKFWNALNKLVNIKYEFKEIQAIDKLDQFCQLAAVNRNIELEDNNNLVMRIKVKKLDSDIMNYKLGGGFFFEYYAKELLDIISILNKPCQTVSYFGIDGHEIQHFVIEHGLRGVDRVVPIGRTMDLTFKWDGFDMIENMSRYVYCPDYK